MTKILSKLQATFYLLEAQDAQMHQKKGTVDEVSLPRECRKARDSFPILRGFVNDSIVFLEMMTSSFWSVLTQQQVRTLAVNFVGAKDTVRRRKAFHETEKEYIRNQTKKLAELEKKMGMRLKDNRALNLLIGKKVDEQQRQPETHHRSPTKHGLPKHIRRGALS
uniref:Uncharacterized protein n=1 Tax=Lotharella globosa TaxID=91324 RepID=A0A7S3YMX7_9EUKA|mmetsp:Transcript_10717/g.21157  ORF Transcript_10717/g.21157 Transcript_10717/m.21157 type:complete len:165 (+) Transcript_10717:31-525(+)